MSSYGRLHELMNEALVQSPNPLHGDEYGPLADVDPDMAREVVRRACEVAWAWCSPHDAGLREAANKAVKAVISSGSGPAAPCFDEHDRAVESRRGKWYKVDGQVIDDLRAALSEETP